MEQERCVKSIAVANARGGVGKTSLACAISLAIAEKGTKTLLVDGDISLANLDVHLGLRPTATLRNVVCDALDLESTVMEGPNGLSVVCGGSGVRELANIDPERVNEIVKNLQGVAGGFDLVVYDTGSGISESPMAFLLAVDRVVLVCTPDPTSVMDAYATVKILFEEKPDADVVLVVNMAEDEKSGLVVYGRFKAIVGQFLNKEIALAGIVPYDFAARLAARERTSFLLSSPNCKAAKAVHQFVSGLFETSEEEEKPDLGLLQRARSVFGFLSKIKKNEEHVSEEKAAA